MAKRAKKIVCFSICIMLLCMNFIPVKAEALPDILCGNSTIADTVMSLYAMSGSAVADSNWIGDLYNSLGSSFGTLYDLAENGMLTINADGTWQATSELTDAIANTTAYTSLGLNEAFNISAEEAATGGGVAAASGAATLAGAVAGVGSTGVIPVLGGVTAAYWGGIALGTLIAHKIGLYGKNITTGQKLTEELSLIPNGAYIGSYRTWGANGRISINRYVLGNGDYAFIANTPTAGQDPTNEGNVCSIRLVNYGYSPLTFFNLRSGNYQETNLAAGTISSGNSSYFGYTDNAVILPTGLTNNQIVDAFRNGTYQRKQPYSPDMIGENGNLDGEYNNDGYTVPDMKPQIDPQTQAGVPLTLQDWLQFANAVKNNNSSADPIGNNQELFDNILDSIRVPNPNTNPDPNPNPDPWSPPVVNPVPDPSYPDPVPDQPTSENPQESENPQQTEPLDPVDTGRPWMLPDLKHKFPFCIPWDIKDCFTLLKSNVRQAPHISWRFNPPHTPIDYTFNLDLSDFDPVATLLRTLELIAFIVGLAFATRYLIGAS